MNVRPIIGPGPCEAEKCKRELQGGDRIIENDDDLVRLQGKELPQRVRANGRRTCSQESSVRHKGVCRQET